MTGWRLGSQISIVLDQLLLSILAGQESELVLSARSNGVATTMCWFYRLSRASAAGATTGALSGRFSALSEAHQAEVLRLVDELPRDILTNEAVATALVLDADIAVAVRSELLDRASAAARVRVVLFD